MPAKAKDLELVAKKLGFQNLKRNSGSCWNKCNGAAPRFRAPTRRHKSCLGLTGMLKTRLSALAGRTLLPLSSTQASPFSLDR